MLSEIKYAWQSIRSELEGPYPEIDLIEQFRRRLVTRPVSADEALRLMVAQLLKFAVRDSFHFRRKSFGFRAKDEPRELHDDFISCWDVLGRRTTTMPNDIHVIVANLMNLDSYTIQTMKKPEDRMAAILWGPARPSRLACSSIASAAATSRTSSTATGGCLCTLASSRCSPMSASCPLKICWSSTRRISTRRTPTRARGTGTQKLPHKCSRCR